jgi:hypothetical protein
LSPQLHCPIEIVIVDARKVDKNGCKPTCRTHVFLYIPCGRSPFARFLNLSCMDNMYMKIFQVIKLFLGESRSNPNFFRGIQIYKIRLFWGVFLLACYAWMYIQNLLCSDSEAVCSEAPFFLFIWGIFEVLWGFYSLMSCKIREMKRLISTLASRIDTLEKKNTPARNA